MLILSFLLGLLLVLHLVLIVGHLDVIDKLLALLDHLLTLSSLQCNLYLLLLLLLLVVSGRFLQLCGKFLSEGAQNGVGEVLQVVTVGLEDVGRKHGTDVWLLIARAL